MIINADSAQVYKELPILSAAPSAAERDAAEHRLFGERDGRRSYSAAEWAEDARREVADVHSAGRPAILVGGTGLYIRTLIDGIAPVPPIDPTVREDVRGASTAENYAQLIPLDPVSAARLNPGDTTRIARALEVVKSTGRTIGAWQDRREGGIGNRVALRPLILLPPRDWLAARCEARFAAMVDGNAVEEALALRSRGYDPSLPVMRAIGLNEILAFADGRITRDEAIAAGAHATRRYAKRQFTWFAHQPPAAWPRFTEPLDADGAVERALVLLGAPA